MSEGFLTPLSQSIKMSVGHGIPLASVGLLTPLSVGIVLIPPKRAFIVTRLVGLGEANSAQIKF